MGILYLSIEIAFDLLTLLIGCLLVFRAKDNHLKRYWGLIAAGIGLVFLWENIGWLTICLLYTSPSPRDKRQSRMPSSA